MDIVEFYKNNPIEIDSNFDEVYYQNKYPDLSGYYLPWAKNNGFSEKQRLFHHYYLYGKKEGRFISLKDEIKKSKIIFLKPTQGLCNRLLLIDSAYSFAKLNNFKIKLCWSFSEGFSDESFEELFDINSLPENFYLISKEEYEEASLNCLNLHTHVTQDKESLKYIFNTDSYTLFKKISNTSFCYNYFASLDWIFETEFPEKNLFIKKYIRPNKRLSEEIESLQIKQDHIGLHIRRGDAINSPWSDYFLQSSTECFHQIAENTKSKIFLSTDCEETQEEFLEKHGIKIIVNKNKKFVDKNISINDRKNYQKYAAIDLFLLSKTRKIFGNNWSTFSQVASIIGSNCLEVVDSSTSKRKPPSNLSAIVAVKNRFSPLIVSIQSWLIQSAIKEIVVVNWSSDDFDENYISSLSDKIKIINVPNKLHFNQSEAYNIAIENASFEEIIKLDADYIINPYIDFNDWLIIDWENEFICGYWKDYKEIDNDCGFLEYLNGFIAISKSNLVKVGGYKGNKYGYGYDDSDLHFRLEEIGLKKIIVEIDKNKKFFPIFHIPHNDVVRTANYMEKDLVHSSNLNKMEYEKNKYLSDNEKIIDFNQYYSEDKVILFCQFFKSTPEVESHNIYCLYKNLNNQFIDQVVLFVEKDSGFLNIFDKKLHIKEIESRLSYEIWYEYALKEYPDAIKVLSNSDIFFDETISKLKKTSKWNDDILYCSSRKDITKDGLLLDSRECYDKKSPQIIFELSQDCWIFKNKLKKFDKNYFLGYFNCDSKLRLSAASNEIKMVNLYEHINCIHVDWRSKKERLHYDV
jgi:hypothetical protein